MAEEVLEIKLTDSSSGGAAGGAGTGGGRGGSSAANTAKDVFDAVAEARKQIEREERQTQVKEQYNLQKFGTPFNPDEMRKKEEEARKEASRKAQEAQQRVIDNIGGITKVAQAAGVPGAGALGGLATAAAAGGPAGIAVSVISIAQSAAAALGEQISDQVAKAGKWNPEVMGALTHAELANMQGEMRRGNFLAPELSAFVEAQSRFNQAKEDALVVLLKPIIPVATQFLELGIKGITFGMEKLQELAKMAEEIDDKSAAALAIIHPGMPLMISYLKQIAKNGMPEEQVADFLDQLLKARAPERLQADQQAERDARPRFPLFAFGGL